MIYEKPSGVWATLLLPIDETDRIDYHRLREEVEILSASGVSGIYSNGTAGEFYSQTDEEFLQINSILATVCQSARLPFQIGASHTSAQGTLQRIRAGRVFLPSAFQVILPDWTVVSNEEAMRFFEKISAEAGDIPLVLYNPPHAKRVLRPDDYLALADAFPTLVGLKVGGGDAGWYQSMKPVMERLSVFVPGHKLASGMAQGAHGSYSNLACLSPGGAQRWFLQMKTSPEAAMELEGRIVRFFDTYLFPLRAKRAYSNPAFDKLLAAIGGWADIGTRLRWPYNWFPENVAVNLRPHAMAELPEMFTPDIAGLWPHQNDD